MKFLVISFFLNLFTIAGFSQNGSITYELNDNKYGTIVFDCSLKYNGKRSSFVCKMRKRESEDVEMVGNKFVKISKPTHQHTFYDVYIDYPKKILYNTQIIKPEGETEIYSVTESIPEFKWTIVDSAKIINKFNCQMAVTSFRGRDYIAWFTPDIPLSLGPWKFNGLPGLILEIYDNQNFFYFAVKKIVIPVDDLDVNIIPQNSNIVPLKEYNDIWKAYSKKAQEDQYRKLMSRIGREGTIKKFEIKRHGLETEYEFEEKE